MLAVLPHALQLVPALLETSEALAQEHVLRVGLVLQSSDSFLWLILSNSTLEVLTKETHRLHLLSGTYSVLEMIEPVE